MLYIFVLFKFCIFPLRQALEKNDTEKHEQNTCTNSYNPLPKFCFQIVVQSLQEKKSCGQSV